MNFFEHQARAQRNSRRLLVIFVLAVIAIVVVADLALLLTAGLTVGGSQVVSSTFWDAIVSNAPLLVGGAVVTKRYAKEIGADGYAADGMSAVESACSLLGVKA